MKTLLSLTSVALLVFGLTFTSPVHSQEKPKDKTTQQGNRNQGKVRPNFVDADGDGICDHQKDGDRVRQHKRLRDGSCGQTPAKDGSGKMQKKGSAK